ncbi:rhodanese-like domain-containing protein [Haladaptatus pallidirubidus]|uniref:Rhodanese-like domain-containing protein n=1 Tax=Haladaptatus pallidirubidus TaxID=1008152 RepID=A0AAV3UL41_9EURY|nr:rhodanese-like domain-containing protein [Haladaptatus pallidirubidus]
MVNQITAEELADRFDDGESMTLIDTRPEDSFEAWHLPEAENVPFDPREGVGDDQLDRVADIDDEEPLVTICGKGLTSTPFAFELEAQGYDDVTVVKGGMEDWSKVYDIVPIARDDEELVVRQIQRRGKGCLGYVVGSTESGEAAVVDPTRQIDVFEVAAEEAGLTISCVFDTHIHADHISGGSRLAETLDVSYYLGNAASERDVEYDYDPVEDGTTVELGDVEITALHAPGHTTEMMNYRIDGAYILTGDTLFVDSVGRTELQFGEEDASEGAELLYDTLHETILDLPDDTRILPGHVAVTSDGQYEGGEPGEPIHARLGDLRDDLDLLQLDEEVFVNRLAENAPEKPPNYETVIAINTGEESPDSEEEATELEVGPNNCAA